MHDSRKFVGAKGQYKPGDVLLGHKIGGPIVHIEEHSDSEDSATYHIEPHPVSRSGKLLKGK